MFRNGFVNLYTSDIDAALRFYRDVLGFEETFRTPKDGTPTHVELRIEGFMVGLSTVEAAKRHHGVDASPGAPVGSIVLWTDEIEVAFERVRDAGVEVLLKPHDAGNNNRNALVRDPDGNLVEIVAKIA